MKKVTFLVLLLLSLSIPIINANAADSNWLEGEVIKGFYSFTTEDDEYTLELKEDAKVTFTLKDSVDLNPEDKYPNYYHLLLKDSSGNRIASAITDLEDGDKEKTVKSINLRKGTYQISVSDGFISKGNYEVSYEISPIEGQDVEPNNENIAANSYKIGTILKGTIYGTTSSYDLDIYKVEVPTFGRLKVIFQQTDVRKSDHLKLEVVNEKREKIFTVKSYNELSEIDVLMQPGTYYFTIGIAAENTPIVNYSLSTQLEPLDKDVWESGRNTAKKSADVIQNNKTVRGFLFGGNYSYDQSRDYYKFTLEKDEKVTFIANYREGFGALSFEDEASGAQLFSGGYVTSDSSQIIETKQLKAGTYYVNFLPRYGIDGYEEYDLTIRIQRFTDVPAMHPYYESIEALAQIGINKGYPDGSFHPKDYVQRQHVFAFINRIEGLNIPKIRNMKSFADVSTSHPFYTEIKKFYEAGIISGYGIYMSPNLNVTRGELAKILVNTFKLKMNGNEIPFKDVKSSNIFYNDIQILASNGITVGAYGKYMPNDPVTREQFSAFLQRMLDKKY
ncbi:S-layer homology domain-containing protein [Ureibacillus sp. GCM10028918]|uniref:S-layer homology domain-containing protein n=1 Tax=Ureibacillus sp. GCM10028918 TaxID=3273429 RepID=UPI003610D905